MTRLRIARPTNDLDSVTAFYRDAFGFAVLGAFENHDGFDGVMLGPPGETWHLEFTRERGVVAPRAPSPEHLLVLYLPAREAWQAAVDRATSAGAPRVRSHNPYWEASGVTFEDPDGFRVVLQNAEWNGD